ncbi:MAG: ATP-binding protein [Clostridia bacterium]
MATVEQIKQLIRYHYERSDEKFKTTVLQIAASEAKAGHSTQARELKDILEKLGKGIVLQFKPANSLFDIIAPSVRLDELVVSQEIGDRIRKIIQEYRQRDKLRKFGLDNRRKILIEGPSGTGKTMTASVLACELNLSLFTIQMDKLISKFMGETSSKLRQLFESIEQCPGVYLFDEFDAIGADRSFDNEVGEMRRVLNAFLQLIEGDSSDSIIVAATNNNQMLDQALYRRFDDVLHYTLPTEKEIIHLFSLKLGTYFGSVSIADNTVKAAYGLSQAEVTRICDELIKAAILNEQAFSNKQLRLLISERSCVYRSKEVQ